LGNPGDVAAEAQSGLSEMMGAGSRNVMWTKDFCMLEGLLHIRGSPLDICHFCSTVRRKRLLDIDDKRRAN
jgi:hypothetical protein